MQPQDKYEMYLVKAVFSVFLIVLIVFAGGMAEKMAKTRVNEEAEYLGDDLLFYDNVNMLVVGMEGENEAGTWPLDR
ncbi:MAG: hypothetical protein AB1650_09205 [Candidatus Omnitrophota bacterium]